MAVERKTHYNLSHVAHEFIHVIDMDKLKPLELLMKEFDRYRLKNSKTSAIVFCNSVQSARAVEHHLAPWKTASLHGDIPSHRRAD